MCLTDPPMLRRRSIFFQRERSSEKNEKHLPACNHGFVLIYQTMNIKRERENS